MTDMARRMRLNTPEELYAAIGYGGIQLSRLMIRIKDEVAKQAREAAPPAVTTVPIRKQKATEASLWKGWTTAPSSLPSAATRCRATKLWLHHPRVRRVHP